MLDENIHIIKEYLRQFNIITSDAELLEEKSKAYQDLFFNARSEENYELADKYAKSLLSIGVEINKTKTSLGDFDSNRIENFKNLLNLLEEHQKNSIRLEVLFSVTEEKSEYSPEALKAREEFKEINIKIEELRKQPMVQVLDEFNKLNTRQRELIPILNQPPEKTSSNLDSTINVITSRQEKIIDEIIEAIKKLIDYTPIDKTTYKVDINKEEANEKLEEYKASIDRLITTVKEKPNLGKSKEMTINGEVMNFPLGLVGLYHSLMTEKLKLEKELGLIEEIADIESIEVVTFISPENKIKEVAKANVTLTNNLFGIGTASLMTSITAYTMVISLYLGITPIFTRGINTDTIILEDPPALGQCVHPPGECPPVDLDIPDKERPNEYIPNEVRGETGEEIVEEPVMKIEIGTIVSINEGAKIFKDTNSAKENINPYKLYFPAEAEREIVGEIYELEGTIFPVYARNPNHNEMREKLLGKGAIPISYLTSVIGESEGSYEGFFRPEDINIIKPLTQEVGRGLS